MSDCYCRTLGPSKGHVWQKDLFGEIQLPGAFGEKVDCVKDLLLGGRLDVSLIEPGGYKSGWLPKGDHPSPPHLEQRGHKTFLIEGLDQSTVDVVRQARSLLIFRHISVPLKSKLYSHRIIKNNFLQSY